MAELIFAKITKCVVSLDDGRTLEIKGAGTVRVGNTEIKGDKGQPVTKVRGASVTMEANEETFDA